MPDISQTIEEIQEEIRKTPYHKGTEHHIGKLRARLAKLKDRELEGTTKSKGGGGGGYAVKKQGDATVVLIGPPSAGKSTLLNKVTNAESKVAPYAFTTVSVIPGMLLYRGAYIQILDVPGLIEGARLGKGRGKEVLSVARAADLLLIMSDVDRQEYIEKLVFELEDAGIRINKPESNVRIEKKTGGGLTIHSNITQDVSKETISAISQEFGIKNAEITLKEKLSIERLIDAFSSSRVYIPALFLVNKIDQKGKKSLPSHSLPISAQEGEGLEELKEEIWNQLALVTIYLVRPDGEPSMNNPMIMKKGDTLKHVAEKIGTDFGENKRLAKIWGGSAHYPGQEVPLTKEAEEGLMVRFIS